jgi:hypothetical protein
MLISAIFVLVNMLRYDAIGCIMRQNFVEVMCGRKKSFKCSVGKRR